MFILGSVFVVLTIVSLVELSYVACVMERKLGSTEHRLRTAEQNLQHYMTQHDILSRELKDIKIELLSTQCEQLAKNRLMKREFRILLKKITNQEEQEEDDNPDGRRPVGFRRNAGVSPTEEDETHRSFQNA